MKLNKLSHILLLLFVTGCGKGGGTSDSSTSTTVQGNDYSGSYLASGLDCYENGTKISSASYDSNSPTTTVVINKNSITLSSNLSSCPYVLSESAVFNASGIVNITGSTIAISGINSCNVTFTLTSVSGVAISPSSLTASATVSSTPTGSTTSSYIKTTNSLGLANSTFKVTGHASAICYSMYIQQ